MFPSLQGPSFPPTCLAKRSLLTDEHLVDSGYMSAGHLVTSQGEHGGQLIGPVLPDPSRQSKTTGAFGSAAFTIRLGESDLSLLARGYAWVVGRRA